MVIELCKCGNTISCKSKKGFFTDSCSNCPCNGTCNLGTSGVFPTHICRDKKCSTCEAKKADALLRKKEVHYGLRK